MSDDDLGCMHDWSVLSTENMQAWMNRLEEYQVFFSAPLDIDFLMLEHIYIRLILMYFYMNSKTQQVFNINLSGNAFMILLRK